MDVLFPAASGHAPAPATTPDRRHHRRQPRRARRTGPGRPRAASQPRAGSRPRARPPLPLVLLPERAPPAQDPVSDAAAAADEWPAPAWAAACNRCCWNYGSFTYFRPSAGAAPLIRAEHPAGGGAGPAVWAPTRHSLVAPAPPPPPPPPGDHRHHPPAGGPGPHGGVAPRSAARTPRRASSPHRRRPEEEARCSSPRCLRLFAQGMGWPVDSLVRLGLLADLDGGGGGGGGTARPARRGRSETGRGRETPAPGADPGRVEGEGAGPGDACGEEGRRDRAAGGNPRAAGGTWGRKARRPSRPGDVKVEEGAGDVKVEGAAPAARGKRKPTSEDHAGERRGRLFPEGPAERASGDHGDYETAGDELCVNVKTEENVS